jgi:acid phosphatase (class A)
MKNRLHALWFILASLVCTFPASSSHLAAQSAAMSADAPGSGPRDHGVYLTGKESVWSSFPKSPALGSEVDQLDLLITLSVQDSRTDAQKDEAVRDEVFSINLVTEVIDPAFATKYPNTIKVLSDADEDEYLIDSSIKRANHRPRPFAQHPTLVRPLFTLGSYSYPSGHASGAEVQARILGKLFPAQARELLKRARQIADSRVVAGVHYASDTEAGLDLGDLIFAELEKTAGFREDLAAAAAKDQIPLK